jgi:NAD(P)-dependent dehydrogenase (short-subunit alcohol dehydrogenase family)
LNLKDRVAVVTGAGSGIGRAIAVSLARRGCHLALADIDEAGLAQTVAEVHLCGVRVTAHHLDVASKAMVRALPASVLAAHGKVDIVVNNAGVALGGNFADVSEEDFDWLMDINFHGVVRMTRAFLPLLLASSDARIVNISSLFGLVAPAQQAAYSASKFAVRGFSNALNHELAGTSVRVTVVHPGGVATRIAKSARFASVTPADEVQRQLGLSEKVLRMPAMRAGEIIVRGIERRKTRILVGADAWLVSILERIAPVAYWQILKRILPA